MDKIGLNYDFEKLTPEMFRGFLRDLQNNGPYQWPNLYFAWEKPNGSLLMVGTKSTMMYNMILREQVPDSWQNKTRDFLGKAPEYSSVLYGISPSTVYIRDGIRLDPVEQLVERVADCKYLGYWQDMDVLMDDPYGYNRVLACGRWELAQENIGVFSEEISLEKKLLDASERSEKSNNSNAVKNDVVKE